MFQTLVYKKSFHKFKPLQSRRENWKETRAWSYTIFDKIIKKLEKKRLPGKLLVTFFNS